MTRRHPDEALVSKTQDTAPPRRRPAQQSPRHGATQTTPSSPIPMTQRHPDDAPVTNPHDQTTPCSPIPMTRRHPDHALVSNPKDTAPPRRRPAQQSPRHGATQTTPWSPIPMTQRHPDHALLTNPNDTAPPRPRFCISPASKKMNRLDPPQPGPARFCTSAAFKSKPFWLARTPAATRTSTATRPWSAIPKTRRRPDDAVISNP